MVSIPEPKYNDLVRVVAIGQTEVHAGIKVVLLALELYADGFILTSRVWSDAPVVYESFDRLAPLEVDTVVTDDRGTAYPGRMEQGSLHISHQQWYGRFLYYGVTPVAPDARMLDIEVAAFRWMRLEPGNLYTQPHVTQPGPWHFTVTLLS